MFITSLDPRELLTYRAQNKIETCICGSLFIVRHGYVMFDIIYGKEVFLGYRSHCSIECLTRGEPAHGQG